MDPYRQKLIMSYLALRSAQEDLIDQIINVGMAGVYKDIGDTFTKDDKYVFDVVQFRGTEDFNLNHLLDVYDEMEYSMDLILFENDILDEEVTEVLKWSKKTGQLKINIKLLSYETKTKNIQCCL